MSNINLSFLFALCYITSAISHENFNTFNTDMNTDFPDQKFDDAEIAKRKLIAKNYENSNAFNRDENMDFRGQKLDDTEISRRKLIAKNYKNCNTRNRDESMDFSEQKLDDTEIAKRKLIAKNYLESLTETKASVGNNMIPSVNEHQTVQPLPAKPMIDDFDIRYGNIEEILDPPVFQEVIANVNEVPGTLFTDSSNQVIELDSIYLTRWLKMIIIKIESDSELQPVALNIPFNSESFNHLKNLSGAKTIDVNKFDELVSKLISNTFIIREENFNWTNIIAYVSSISLSLLKILGILSILLAIYLGVTRRPITFITLVLSTASVFWHWMRLYQKQIALKHSQLSLTIPLECEKSNFGLMEHVEIYFKSFFFTNDCKKYYEALLVNPMWEVSITVAMADAVTSVFVQPLYAFSKAINDSVKLLFDDLSVLRTMILIVFIFLILILIFNYKIKLPFFMGSIEPNSNEAHSHVEDVQPLKKIQNFKSKIEYLEKTLAMLKIQNSSLCDNEPYNKQSAHNIKDNLLYKNSLKSINNSSSAYEVAGKELEISSGNELEEIKRKIHKDSTLEYRNSTNDFSESNFEELSNHHSDKNMFSNSDISSTVHIHSDSEKNVGKQTF